MENREIIKNILNILHESVKMQNKVAKNGIILFDFMEKNTDDLVLLLLKIIKHDISDMAVRHFKLSILEHIECSISDKRSINADKMVKWLYEDVLDPNFEIPETVTDYF
jgi:hypothetical protein